MPGRTPMDNVQRSFIIGGAWLYYKIYTGPKTSDLILTQLIKPATEYLLENNIINQWFFIRYADPKHHLRIRFHYYKPENIAILINTLYESLNTYINEGLIWKIQTDTYQRELERYGPNTITIAEELFYHDSIMIVNFIDLIAGEEGEELRWLFALRAIDSLLGCYRYTDEEKCLLSEDLKTGFGKEFGMDRSLKRQLDARYRAERKKIEHFMQFKKADHPEYTPILNILETKETQIKHLTAKTLQHKQQGSLRVEFNNLMASHIHMLMNRLFRSKNRLHEMVYYDFLYRYYKSMIARKNSKKPQKPQHVNMH